MIDSTNNLGIGETELNTISEVLRVAKNAKKIMVWSNWTENDGDYFKVEKKYFLSLISQYKNNEYKLNSFRLDNETNILWVG